MQSKTLIFNKSPEIAGLKLEIRLCGRNTNVMVMLLSEQIIFPSDDWWPHPIIIFVFFYDNSLYMIFAFLELFSGAEGLSGEQRTHSAVESSHLSICSAHLVTPGKALHNIVVGPQLTGERCWCLGLFSCQQMKSHSDDT